MYKQNNDIKDIYFDNALKIQKEKEHNFNSYTQNIKKLLFLINQNKYFKDFVKNKNNEELVKNLFLNYSMLDDSIFQLRYLDGNGQEIIRIDQERKNKVVEKKNLQNKKNRYYFDAIYKLNRNEIWLSNIDLNTEHGKIEIPYKPTLRIGLPVYVDEQKKGILIINLNVSRFLNVIKENTFFWISIIDGNENILITNKSKYDWSKYLNTGKKIYDVYPELKNKKNQLNIKKLDIKSSEELYLVFEAKEIDYVRILKERTEEFNFILLYIFVGMLSIAYILAIFLDKKIKSIEL